MIDNTLDPREPAYVVFKLEGNEFERRIAEEAIAAGIGAQQ